MYIHEIKLQGNDDFANKFNECSELFTKSQSETITEEEREVLLNEFIAKRLCLELGIR